jgi:chaperonin GroEL (HSP60 family)
MFKRNTDDCKLSTIVLRGSTLNILEDIERAIDDGVHVFRSLIKNPEFLPGSGSTETVRLFLLRFFQLNWKQKARRSLALTNTVSADMLKLSKFFLKF